MILAAGKGTRLFPLTGEIPKPLAPVANTPIIEHLFKLLAPHGITEAYVNVHHLADALLSAYGEKQSRIDGMAVRLAREEELTGTAGAVNYLAEIAPAGTFEDTFVVVSGDALTDIDLTELIAFHKKRGALATIALHRIYNTKEFGVVETDEEGNILSFQEKPDPKEAISTLANTGIYVFEPDILAYIPNDTFFDFAHDVFPRLLEEGERFLGYQGEFYWSDIGTLEAYRMAQYDVLSGRVRVKVPGERWGETLWMGENAQVHPSAKLQGYVVVGRDAMIEEGAVLLGDVTMGSECWVHPNATIERSILLPGARVGKGAYLKDCIVGHGYDVRAGETITGEALMRRSIACIS